MAHRIADSINRLFGVFRSFFADGPELTKTQGIALGATLLFDGLLVIAIALRDFFLTKTAVSTLGSGLLLVIGVVNLWALFAFVRKPPILQFALTKRTPTWKVAAVVAQGLVVVLAGYVVLMDVRSPNTRIVGVSGIAILVGLAALLWVVRLGRHATITPSKGMAAVAALVPLLGLFQYWLETDYVPRTSRPLVDVVTELTPVGKSGRVIHLSAKVVLHNRGTVQVNVAGTLMRVTGYPRVHTQEWADPERVARALDLSGANASSEFRTEPTIATDGHLLYADDFISAGSLLVPGGTYTMQRTVDIDPAVIRLARLSVSTAFITDRRIKDTRPCYPPKISYFQDVVRFAEEAAKPHLSYTGGHFLCIDNEIAPRNVIQEMVADQPVLRVYIMVDDPTDRDNEYPQLSTIYGTPRGLDQPGMDLRAATKIEEANPTLTYLEQVVEYMPSDSVTAPPK